MTIEEQKCISCLRTFEIQFARYIRRHSNLNILGKFQLNYECRKIFGKDSFKKCTILTIKDEKLCEDFFDRPKELKGLLVDFCGYASFDFRILKPFLFVKRDDDVFITPGKNIIKRVSFEYFSNVLNPNFSFLRDRYRF